MMGKILPPASILEKIKAKDPALVEEIFNKADSYGFEPATPRTTWKHKLKLMFQGAASVFGGPPLALPQTRYDDTENLTQAWKATGNKLRRAMKEIISDHDIRLTPQELKALEPI